MRVELRRIGDHVLALVSTLLIGLAAGAIWVVLALYAQRDLTWLALPLGALLGWVMRAWVTPARWPAIILAAVGMAVASVYMRLLFAAAQVGASLGLGFGEALYQAGLGMLLQVTRMGVHRSELVLYAIAVLVAALVAGSGRRSHVR